MKKLLSFIAIAAVLVAAGCSRFSNRGEVEKPFIDAANTPYLSFERVNLTDSSTELGAVVHFRPGWWIRFDSSSVIVAEGKEYPVISVDSLSLGEQYVMPDSGVAHFTMRFPAIPASVKSIDFSENIDGGWTVLGIHLDKNYKYESEIPADMSGCAEDAVLPDVDMSRDTTTVRVHLLNYRPEMGSKLNYVVNTIAGQQGDMPALDIDAEGNATFSKVLLGPEEFIVIGLGSFPGWGRALITPGESIDLYIDCRIAGFNNMRTRDGSEQDMPFAFSGSTGKLDKINRSTNKTGYFGLQLRSGTFGDYRMSGDEYADYVIKQYESSLDSINAADVPAAAKELMTVCLQADVISAISNADRILRRNYSFAHDTWEQKVPDDSIDSAISPESVRKVVELIDINNPKLFYSYKVTSPDDLVNTEIWKAAGMEPVLLDGLRAYIEAREVAVSAGLDSTVVGQLRDVCPAYADEVLAQQKESEAVLASAAAAMVEATPDVPADKVFDEIVKPYKGKVVVVDLWNTWCGPCRHALKENEPLKDGALSSDDIVWIYIADETSPLKTYFEMIPGIRGHHFRVSGEQIAKIRERFDVDGIPYYIIVDRQGKAEGRPDLRDHDKYVSTILDKLK